MIVVAVRWYLRYNLSYRDIEELLVKCGVEVDHVSVFRWVQRFTPLLAELALLAGRVGEADWPGRPDRWGPARDPRPDASLSNVDIAPTPSIGGRPGTAAQ